ncbi:methionine--tRNA ligase [Rubrivirga litoralis]|uniref:Methionine--tRNA ligase n=1 Tax=Rubrivirga litoralis TaxID=3075598 RepID=A0ABU3BU32_9BACT|nr:methionine--tRNA ligase [Rubrivirga sp. F394]MDT0632750.1 methionine--tRNA ligase [Rubrivirga sp. F394]
MPDRPLLVTSALPYANGPLHLGHLAGAYLPADLFVRYQRLRGRDVVWVCGSDEHGAAIAIRARQEGTTPQAIVDRYHAELESAFAGFGIAFDAYGRTTSETHRETSQDLFRAIDAAGGFVRKTATQLYDPEAGLFLADRFVKGTCPVCGYDQAYGDQCENCGSTLSPDDLVEPRSTLSGAAPERRETTHWYLPLGDLQPALEQWIGTRAGWKPNVLGQVRSWLDAGLSPRAMTRDLDWGISVPPDVEGDTDGKVLYVWFDAPIGYLSITKEWAAAQGDAERWRRYWQVHEDGTAPELVHFIGKDNIVFHCLIFPAILMATNRAADAAGNAAQPDLPQLASPSAEQFVLPENVPANEFLNLEGQKLSTSRGWAVWAEEALQAFPADALRYALAVGLPETKDADFTWSDFQNRVNGELADVVGNFCNRALTFADRFTGGAVPPLEEPSEADRELLAALAAAPPEVGALYEQYRLRDAVARTVALARAGNQYLQETEPWKTRKTDERAMRNTVHVALQVCAGLSVLLDPVVPETARRLREMLNLEGVRSSAGGAGANGAAGGEGEAGIGWADAGRPLLQTNHPLGTPGILVRKIEDDEVEAQRQLLDDREATATGDPAAADSGEPYAPLSAPIAFDQFTPLDLRAGRILAADLHPNADKLLRFDVDLGFETRQILSGVREHFAPDDLVGRTVVVVANLAPRTIRGLESQGMILFAENRDGALLAVEADGEPGAVVR